MFVVEFFLPLSDHTEVTVVDNGNFNWYVVVYTGHKLLYIHLYAAISRYKQQILGQQKSTKKPDEEKKPTPETPVHEIKSIYQKEGGNPDKPLDLERNKLVVIEGTGLKLLDSTGKLAGNIILTATWYEDPTDEKVDAELITVNTDTRIEFTMIPYLGGGNYLLRIETYYNGEGNPPLEEPNVIKFPKEITLI